MTTQNKGRRLQRGVGLLMFALLLAAFGFGYGPKALMQINASEGQTAAISRLTPFTIHAQ